MAQESQRLMVGFVDYPAALLRLLNQCIREPHLHLAVYVMQPNGEARLDFIHNMEYKFVEMLSARFVASPEDVVRQQVCGYMALLWGTVGCAGASGCACLGC